ncbi:hypothetical protein [Marinilabilia salmonicolor]|uniref:hypothetical protein n=1 Tax=Marinilabilia salmonicolor TaxID=989 RepID=UPI0011B1E4D3|nr:hypothetical protein [Marinilabilia salmonicolor]
MRRIILCFLIVLPAYLKSQTADVTIDESISGSWTFYNPLRLHSRQDGKVLLRFDTEREWFFKQAGSGANTGLSLVSKVNHKNFSIEDYASGKRTIVFYSSSNGGAVHLVPDGGYVSFPNGRILSNGRMGIGTTSPNAELEVKGSLWTDRIKAGGVDVTGRLTVNNTFSKHSPEPEDNRPFEIKRHASDHEMYQIFVQDTKLHHVYDNDEASSAIEFRLRNTDKEAGGGSRANDRVVLAIKSDPNSGTVKVDGSLIAEEVKVELLSTEDMHLNGTLAANNITLASNGNTADFVFEEDYLLRNLNQVEEFIKQNKHLPDIPSAAEMEVSGVNLAEMNKLLLQKIEELTLYLIEKDKQVCDLTKQLNQIGDLRRELDEMNEIINQLKNQTR